MLYKNGVRAAKTYVVNNKQLTGKRHSVTTDILDIVGLHRSILRAPICVGSEAAAKKIASITVYFRDPHSNEIYGSFTLAKQAGELSTNLPTIDHAFWLEVMLGLFASNWQESGELLFQTPSVLKIGGFPNDSSARKTLFEMILRYSKCPCNWLKSFGRHRHEFDGFIITEQDIWTDDFERVNVKRGRIPKIDAIHSITFNKQIVEALDPRKNPETRLFPSSIFRAGISRAAFTVHRHFYASGDLGGIWKNLFDPSSGLIHVFSWQSNKSKFLLWLQKQLQELQAAGLIIEYQFNESNSAVRVTLAKVIDTSQVIDIDSISNDGAATKRLIVEDDGAISARNNRPKSTKRAGATKINIDNLTPLAAKMHYDELCRTHTIHEQDRDIVEMLCRLGTESSRSLVTQAIKNLLKKHLKEGGMAIVADIG